MKKRRFLALVVGLILFLSACGSQQAKDHEVIVLKANQPVDAKHPYHLGLEKFAEIVEEKTEGRYKIDIYSSGQLGDERTSIENLQLGSLDIAVTSTGPLGAFLKNYQILDFPFLFSSYEEADASLKGPLGQRLLEDLKSIGLVGGAFWENGFRNVTTSKKWGPVKSMEDMKGLKIRTMENEIHMKFFKALGADPTPMSWAEVFSQLQNGGLDAQENPIPVLYNNKLNEVQDYVMLTHHVYSPALIVFSQKTLDKMDEKDVAIFMEAAKEAAIYEKEQIRSQEKDQLAKLEGLGMELVELELDPFQEVGKNILEENKVNFDEEILDLLFTEK